MDARPPARAEDVAHKFHLLSDIEAVADAVALRAEEERLKEMFADLAKKFQDCQQIAESLLADSHGRDLTADGEQEKIARLEELLARRRTWVQAQTASPPSLALGGAPEPQQ